MRESFTFKLLTDIRANTLNTVSRLPVSQYAAMPSNFNNHIHWQLGHLLKVTDELIFVLSGMASRIDEDYRIWFAPGTRPSEWSSHPGKPPEAENIVKLLGRQIEEIPQQFSGKFQEAVAVKDNFIHAATIGELFQVFIAHESHHAAVISSMASCLRNR